MTDQILAGHLTQQNEAMATFAAASSRISYKAIRTDENLPPNLFMVEIACRHLISTAEGIAISDEPALLAIRLHEDYLRAASRHPGQIVSIVSPNTIFAPNVAFPYVCTGPIAPGTRVPDLILRTYEILTYNRFTPREDDALNAQACRWARAHMDMFPLECEPLCDLDKGSRADAAQFVLEPLGDAQ